MLHDRALEGKTTRLRSRQVDRPALFALHERNHWHTKGCRAVDWRLSGRAQVLNAKPLRPEPRYDALCGITNTELRLISLCNQGETWWAASDLGWVVGHSYIVYGPLVARNTTVLYEGKPIGTPDASAYFRVIAEHGVRAMFTAPTAMRAIIQNDPEAEMAKKYSFDHLRAVFVAGEHCDHETMSWIRKVFGRPAFDHWWQTETGWPITATCVGLLDAACVNHVPSGVSGKPVPGFNGESIIHARSFSTDGSTCLFSTSSEG